MWPTDNLVARHRGWCACARLDFVVYESNPKHSVPWQRGAQGSPCPPDIDRRRAQALLEGSELSPSGGKRFVTDGGELFAAKSIGQVSGTDTQLAGRRFRSAYAHEQLPPL